MFGPRFSMDIHQRGRNAVRGSKLECFAIIKPEHPEPCLAEPGRVRQHRLKNRDEVAGRA